MRRDVEARGLVSEIEDDLIGRIRGHPILGEDVPLLMRPTDEYHLCVSYLDDLLKLAPVPVALIGIEPPEHLKDLATSEKILELTRRPPRRFEQPHACEANLVELVQVEHFFKVAPRSIQYAEDQSRVS